MFVFEEPRRDGIEATAEAQLDQESAGATTDARALDPPSES
jgi:hypothetical protein